MTIADFDEVVERLARTSAARASRTAHPAITAMMAGGGARLVADQNMARAILQERVRRSKLRRHPDQDHRAGSGSRPVATPLPVSSKPATVTAGALPHEPETSRE